MNFFVYILECSNSTHYVGVTNDYERRLYEHQTGFDKNSYTYKLRPVKLIYVERFSDVNHAIEFEKQVKGWSRKKRLLYIEKSFDGLEEYNKQRSSIEPSL
jgi:putative endonuclease